MLITIPKPPKKPAAVNNTRANKQAAETLSKEKGGAAKVANVLLRIPDGLLTQIDHALASRKVKIPRHTWLLEAIVDKLDHEP